ncbi:MAG: secretin N-terminal domain-containing protein [Synergistaceae bacterium]|nr:secretin N-terminal domain-containing protein [Synergistaceae bacterium]
MARKYLCYKNRLKLILNKVFLLLIALSVFYTTPTNADEATQITKTNQPSVIYGIKAGQLGASQMLFEIAGENLPSYSINDAENFLEILLTPRDCNIIAKKPKHNDSSLLGFSQIDVSVNKTFTFFSQIPLCQRVDISMKDNQLFFKFVSNKKLVVKRCNGAEGSTLFQFYVETADKFPEEDLRKIKPNQRSSDDPINNKTKIAMDFRRIYLHDLLRFMAEKLKMNFMADFELPNPELSLKFESSRFCDVFSYLINTYKISYSVIGNTLIVGTKENIARATGRFIVREYPIYYASVKDIVANLKEMFDLKNGITINERLRTLYIRATHDDHVQISDMITRLDKPSKQVMLEARLIEVKDDADMEVEKLINIVNNGLIASFSNKGISARYTDYGGGVVPNVNPTGETKQGQLPIVATETALNTPTAVVDHAMHMIDAGLRAIETKEKGKVLAAPSIATLNGQKAVVKLTHNYLYQTGVDRSSNPQFREQETGPTLEFTPVVGNDGYITITITIKAGDIVKFRTSGISEVPETANREATTQIRVRDGELFVLGGLYEHTKTKVTTGIPIISKIPLLGELFKNRSEKDNKSQLAFIAIPHILME